MEVVPDRMNSFEVYIVLVPPILMKLWMNMMCFVMGALAMKTVSGSSRAVDRQDRAVTPLPKLAKSSAMVLSLTSFCGCSLKWFSQEFDRMEGMISVVKLVD